MTVDVYAGDGTTLLGTVRTDNSGAWTTNIASGTGYVIKARAINDGATVADDANPVYTVSAGTIGAGGGVIAPITLNAKTGTNAERAFAVADALQTSWLHAELVRGAGNTANLPTDFGNVDNTGASYFDSGMGKIYITQRRRFAWDVLGHEYGHYLANLDTLDQNPGGSHANGVSNIPANPTAAEKTDGVRLAWGEGVASYIGISAQNLAAAPASPTVGNSSYESFDADLDPNGLFGFNLEDKTATVGGDTTVAVGEGDEATTARVLWDLADSTNETHDRIALGHAATYTKLKNGSFDSLGALWTNLITGKTDAETIDYGGIFELNGASPDPSATAIVDGSIDIAAAAPTFDWLKGNDAQNDLFNLTVWNSDFTSRLLDIAIPGNVDTYTLTAGQWDTLNDYLGVARFSISGSDTSGFATPAYWSDAYSFTLVPEPATLGLLTLGAFGMIRRRK